MRRDLERVEYVSATDNGIAHYTFTDYRVVEHKANRWRVEQCYGANGWQPAEWTVRGLLCHGWLQAVEHESLRGAIAAARTLAGVATFRDKLRRFMIGPEEVLD